MSPIRHRRFTRLVFLDFDGVLHPGLAGTLIYLDKFETFLREHPEVAVVYSTSWRQQKSFETLRGYFSPELQDRMLGVTPELPEAAGSRLAEIHEWLRWQRRQFIWAALDDDAALFPPFCEQLVLCATARGLRQAQVDELRAKLRLTAP